MPAVSVVMPVYNSEKYVAEAIESILGQTFSDFELIIVDDGSQDRSSEIIREYVRRDERVRLLRQDRNSGVSCARNRGSDDAGGEFVAFMDSDDVSLPTRLEKQSRFLQEHPEIGAVGIRYRVANHDLTASLGPDIVPLQHARIVFNQFTEFPSFVVGGGLMIRPEQLRAVGGWNESLRYGEEADLFVRLLLQTRIRFANLSEILYVQRLHDSNKSSSPEKVAGLQNNVWLQRRLEFLWDEVTDDTLIRFRRLKHKQKLNWSERRAAKADLKRLMKTLIERQLVDPSDRPLLVADMNCRLEQASPRLWQMICHWRRHRFGARKT